MSWIKIPVSCAVVTCAIVLAVAVGKAETEQRTKLKLNLQRGKIFTFQLNVPPEFSSFSTTPASPSSAKSSATNPNEERKSEDAQKRDDAQNRETQRREEGTAQRGAMEDLEYRIEVQDTAGDETTLNVRVSQNSPSASSSGRSSGTAGAASKSGVEPGSYTFKVDSRGRVCDSKSTDPNRSGVIAPRSEEKRGSEKPESGQILPHVTPPPILASQVQMILGCGLHDQDLEVGKTYKPMETAANAGSSSRERKDPSANPSEAHPAHPGEAQHPDISVRFDGISRVGNLDLARFTVFAPMASTAPASSRKTEKTESTPDVTSPREGKEPAGTAQSGRTEERLGEATYRTSDGILERCSVICPITAEKIGATPADPSKASAATITIRRMDSGTPVPGTGSK